MAISVISSTGAQFTSAQSTLTLGSPTGLVGGGAIIVCVGGQDSSGTASTVYDNTANVYVKAISTGNPNPLGGLSIWYATNISSLSTLISATMPTSTVGAIAALHVTGISTGTPLQGTASSVTAGFSSVHNASNFTPSTHGLAVAFGTWNSAGGPIGQAPGANYTEWPSSVWSTMVFAEYWNQSSPTATDGPYTSTTLNTKALEVLAYFSDTVGGAAAGYYAPPAFLQLGFQ